MPLPLILGIGAAIAAAGGVGAGINGGVKMKKAKDKCKEAQERQERNVSRMNQEQEKSTAAMDRLGKEELYILKSFEEFQNLLEQIQNRPDFKQIQFENIEIPEYNPDDIKQAHVGAGILLGGLGGAAAGTAGGFAAAGATTAAVMALGTASTGTAIASLSGAAAVNATLAALGGGALAAGGGGMALGAAVLGGATLGVALLVGGIIFNFTGGKISDKADKAWEQMLENEKEINRIINYLDDLRIAANGYYVSLEKVERVYYDYLKKLADVLKHKTDWYQFTDKEMMNTETLVMTVGILYNMCKVKLVLQSSNNEELNKINYADIRESQNSANDFLNAINA